MLRNTQLMSAASLDAPAFFESRCVRPLAATGRHTNKSAIDAEEAKNDALREKIGTLGEKSEVLIRHVALVKDALEIAERRMEELETKLTSVTVTDEPVMQQFVEDTAGAAMVVNTQIRAASRILTSDIFLDEESWLESDLYKKTWEDETD